VRFRRPVLRFALDEGVPNSVGRVLSDGRHKVIYLNQGALLPRGSPDEQVSAFSILNKLILVATDGDMRRIATGHGVGPSAYSRLNLLKLTCPEPMAAQRVEEALSLIEHEWHVNSGAAGRQLFIEILISVIRTNR
jgi:predicted nuclease of predicted toxin-antitoxin system